jgi:endo-1,4-beta-xylanase
MQPNHNATLRSLAEQRGILIGAAARSQALRIDYAYRETLAEEFNLLTPENEMKFGPLSPHPGAYDFGPGLELVRFAQANDMKVRGHTLLWHEMNPVWLKEIDYNRNQALDLLHKHIFTLTGMFYGEIHAWDVVNEPIDPGGGMRDSFWLHTIGPDYLEYALRWMHEADPHAKLFVNDYGVEGMNGKSNGLYEMLRDLRKRDVPLDGVGMQMHGAVQPTEKLGALPAMPELLENIQRFGDLGLEVHITEMDVAIQGLGGTLEERLQKQAGIFADVLRTALCCPQFKAFILWGFSDRHSWIPQFTGSEDAPLIFDEFYQPKPAYEAIYKVLETT